MSRCFFDRRTFLAGTGISAGLLPLLASRRAQAATPKRLVVIAVPNGYTDDYTPNGVGANWTAKDVEFSPLKPLEKWKDRILVMGGIDVQNGADTAKMVKKDPNAGIGGHAILPFLFTGARGLAGPDIPDGWSLSSAYASVDQHVVKYMPGAKERPFPSLVLRPLKLGSGGYGNNPLSYSGATDGKGHNAPTIRDNPITLFDDLFGGNADLAALAKSRKRRESILNFTLEHLNRFRGRVSKEDAHRIDRHLGGVRQIEKQVQALGGACNAAAAPKSEIWNDTQNNPNMDKVMRAQIDMTVAAMACDLTRVASMSWCQSNNNTVTFPWLADRIPSLNEKWTDSNNAGSGNDLRNHHTIAHNDSKLRREKNLIDQFWIENYAYMIEKLATTQDADGAPMLDNTLVLFANMQRTGGGHQTTNLTWFLAGNCDGYFKTGRYIPWVSGIDKKGAPTNGILTALVNATGCPRQDHFAEPEYGGEWKTLQQ